MFETEIFKTQLTNTVASQAGESGVAQYQVRIVDYLQDLAVSNENFLMESELRKAASLRRGVPDALSSTKTLVKEASAYALADKRTVVTVADVEKAYRAKFCSVWPFCK